VLGFLDWKNLYVSGGSWVTWQAYFLHIFGNVRRLRTVDER
jgi:hypothetical protein